MVRQSKSNKLEEEEEGEDDDDDEVEEEEERRGGGKEILFRKFRPMYVGVVIAVDPLVCSSVACVVLMVSLLIE